MVALSTSTISVPFLIIWTVSPSLRLDLSKSDFKINVDPLILSISKVHEVLYIQELNHTSFLLLSVGGLGTTSPTFLTVILSPSVATLDPSDGKSSNSDNTPVILSSTFLVKSPSSYPNTFSSDLKSSVVPIAVDTPTQFKNWLTVLSVYVIVLIPEITVPVVPNPTVESTVITEDPTDTLPITLVLPGIVNVPWIPVLSLKPTNRLIL